MADTYEEYFGEIEPPWYQGKWAKRFFGCVGRQMDANVELFREAVLARLPLFAPDDALEVIGENRMLPRGSTETLADYRARLMKAWELWAGDNTPGTGKGGGAGSHLGMLVALKAAGLPTGANGATIVQQNGRYAQLDGSGNLVLGTLATCANRMNLLGNVEARPGWTFDGRDNFYSVFAVVVPTPVTVDAAAVNAAVEAWRPAKAIYVGAFVITAGRVLGWPVSGALGGGAVLGGHAVTFIPGAHGHHTRLGYSP